MKFLQSLQRFRMFRVGVQNPGQFYRDTIADIEWFNAKAGLNMFNRSVNLLNLNFCWMMLMLVSNIYCAPETVVFYRDDIDKVLMGVVTLGFLFQVRRTNVVFCLFEK